MTRQDLKDLIDIKERTGMRFGMSEEDKKALHEIVDKAADMLNRGKNVYLAIWNMKDGFTVEAWNGDRKFNYWTPGTEFYGDPNIILNSLKEWDDEQA